MSKSSELVEAVLLAAGLGTRMLPFTENIAKPFLPLLEVPTIQYSLDWLDSQNVSQAVVNLHYRFDDSLKRLESLDAGKIKIEVSDERRELLGSGGGVRQAMEKISSDRFLLVNSDTLFFPEIQPLLKRHSELRKKFGVEATLAVFEKSPSGAQYREIQMDASRDTVRGIGEKKVHAAFFTGVAVFEKSAIVNLPLGAPSDLLSEVLIPLSKTGKLGVWLTQGLWLDLGEPKQWADAHFEMINAYESKVLPEKSRRRLRGALESSSQIVFDIHKRNYRDQFVSIGNGEIRFSGSSKKI